MNKTFICLGNEALGGALTSCLENCGYTRADDFTQARYIFTYFPLLSALEDAYFDAGGIMSKATKGTYLIDLSPATPNFARELSAVASVSDLHFVEAPIGVLDPALDDAFSDSENLQCTIAGDAPDTAVVKELLELFVGQVFTLNEPGSAQLAHAAWSLQQTAQIFSAIESEALYRAMRGIPTAAAAASDGEAAVVGPLQAAVVQAVSEKRFHGSYTVEMFMADLSAALTAADEVGLILPQAEACMNLLDLLATIGGIDYAPAALALIYDEEEAAHQAGLDWARAAEYNEEMGAHSHDHIGFADDDDDESFGGYADLFGDFSNN